MNHRITAKLKSEKNLVHAFFSPITANPENINVFSWCTMKMTIIII